MVIELSLAGVSLVLGYALFSNRFKNSVVPKSNQLVASNSLTSISTDEKAIVADVLAEEQKVMADFIVGKEDVIAEFKRIESRISSLFSLSKKIPAPIVQQPSNVTVVAQSAPTEPLSVVVTSVVPAEQTPPSAV